LFFNLKSEISNLKSLMKLTINGEDREFPANLTVASLLARLGMKPDRVAVELKRNLIPRERWDKTPLFDNDKLEIVHFVGGGSAKS
jgi:thiazole synthase